MEDKDFEKMKVAIRRYCAIDLDNYKEAQMRRRLAGYLKDRQTTVEAFVSVLASDKAEAVRLSDFITINVTEFFRDSAHFQELETRVLPELLMSGRPLSIWSAGCSRGAEAYSLAMLLKQLKPMLSHAIVGTDIDDRSLAVARAGGPYLANELRGIPQALRDKYFDGELVSAPVRKMVRFESRDLLTSTLAGPFDLIVCRNVVIYFNEEAKGRLNDGFAKALRPGGLLFIGATEVLLNPEKHGLRRVAGSFFERMPEQQRAAA